MHMPSTFRVRSLATRFNLTSFVFALGAGGTLVAATAAAQGSSYSVGEVWDNNAGTNLCNRNNGPAPSSSVTCAAPVTGGTASGSSSSNNAARAASASASAAQSSFGRGYSYQTNVLTVVGTPQAGDRLVFHFLTSAILATGSGGDANGGSTQWELDLGEYTSDSHLSAFVNQYAYADGTRGPINLTNASQTAGGFDLFLPFTSSGNAFGYYFLTLAASNTHGQPAGTMLNASITTTLEGLDVLNANGSYVSSASFDTQTGAGSINADAPSTVPEPNSIALLATGLACLVPIVRRKRKE